MNDDNLFKKPPSSSTDNSNDKNELDNSSVEDNNSINELKTSNQTAKSLFELFGTSNSGFFDPTITEKENSKPAKQLQQQQSEKQNDAKKMSKKQRREAGILTKKELKKKKYLESLKEKQKREQEWKDKLVKMGDTICKFYLEGRCTKGDECQFSHNALINKKTEVCKYYLNGYCAKNANCTFMHAEFPCKFFHANKECKSGTSCRFSHEPMNAEMREIFVKFLKETDEPALRLSLLGSPPRQPHQQQQQQTVRTAIPSLLAQPVIPSLMNITVKKKQPPSLMSNLQFLEPIKQETAPISPLMSSLFSQDIDERCIPVQATINTDIDERAAIIESQPIANNLLTNLFENNLDPLVKLLQHQQKPQPDLVTTLLPALITAAVQSTSTPASVSQTNDAIINSLLKNLKTEPLEIDARTDGTLPYKAIPIYIPPSPLWTNPPVSTQSHSADSECDPRIEFYSNKLNNKNFNTDSKLPNLVNINTQLFSSTTSASALSPPQYASNSEDTAINIKQQTIKPLLPPSQSIINREYKDPRLLAKTSALIVNEVPTLNDFHSYHNQIINNRSDLMKIQQNNLKSESNTVRLSIADYKRKIQRPNDNEPTNINQINITPSSYSPLSSGISEFKAPQSLHELLKNYPS